MRVPVDAVRIRCDRCNRLLWVGDSDFFHSEDANDRLDEMDWALIEGKDYCPSCVTWSDAEDNLVPLPPIEKVTP